MHCFHSLQSRKETSAMYSITDLKKGTLIELDGEPYRVVEYAQKQLGRGGSIVNVKIKNLRTSALLSKTFRGQDKITPAESSIVSSQYLYSDASELHFMRSDNYDQVAIPRSVLDDEERYLKEGMDVKLLYINDKPLSVDLPIKVEYEVISADPGIKGDSAGSVTKSCETETGHKVQVPLFINAGDNIRVDTRTGEYIERV